MVFPVEVENLPLFGYNGDSPGFSKEAGGPWHKDSKGKENEKRYKPFHGQRSDRTATMDLNVPFPCWPAPHRGNILAQEAKASWKRGLLAEAWNQTREDDGRNEKRSFIGFTYIFHTHAKK